MKVAGKLAAVFWCASTFPLLSSLCDAQLVSIATVPVGSVNNAPDPDNGFGSVSYEYNIATYDVTSSQYCAFLNAVAASDPYGIYHPAMAGTSDGNPGIVQNGVSGNYTYTVIAGRGNYPVTDVTFWNATRFANWLNNGERVGAEGAGTTETGAYNLLSTSMDASLVITPYNKNMLTTSQQDDNSVARSANASWAVTSENEWYKAAYYDPTRTISGASGYYYDYTNRSDNMNASQLDIGGDDTTPVGSYSATTWAGTYDQGGDVYQWNETITNGWNVRGMRGGAFDDGGDLGRAASFESSYQQPYVTDSAWGFRVVQLNTFAPGGLLNILDKTVILPNPPAGALATVMSELRSGYNNGNWNGTSGIISSTAAADAAHLTAVGVLINDTGANCGNATGTAIFTTIDGSSTVDGDILLKTTYYGDANLSGSVDGSDYSLIDNGYLNQHTGWYNGDFNYDGIIDGSDYALIDNAFNMQGVNLGGGSASSTAQIAGISPVPEPTTALIGSNLIGLLARRKRLSQLAK